MDGAAHYPQESLDQFNDWNQSKNSFADSAIGSTEFIHFDSSDIAIFEDSAAFTTFEPSMTYDPWFTLFPDGVSTEQPQNNEPPLVF
jgi:hypothetical protein